MNVEAGIVNVVLVLLIPVVLAIALKWDDPDHHPNLGERCVGAVVAGAHALMHPREHSRH